MRCTSHTTYIPVHMHSAQSAENLISRTGRRERESERATNKRNVFWRYVRQFCLIALLRLNPVQNQGLKPCCQSCWRQRICRVSSAAHFHSDKCCAPNMHVQKNIYVHMHMYICMCVFWCGAHLRNASVPLSELFAFNRAPILVRTLLVLVDVKGYYVNRRAHTDNMMYTYKYACSVCASVE